jgi:hypothetical protein
MQKKQNIDFKSISLKIIEPKIANSIIENNHYSGSSVKGVKYHIGIFYDGDLMGVAQYGFGIKPKKTAQWVKNTKQDEFLELNRLWLHDNLGFNSESYVIAKSLKMVKKINPNLKWVISFADGMMNKNGTIYQASNFVYTGFRKDGGVWYTKDGERLHSVSLWHKHKTIERRVLENIYGLPLYKVFGGQYRYFYFFDKKYINDLIIDVLSYPKLEEIKNDLVVKTKYGINNHNENYDMFMKLLSNNNGISKKVNKEKIKEQDLYIGTLFENII